MNFRTLFLLIFSLFGVWSFAAPVPVERKKEVIYFPTEPGAKWVYETPDGELESVKVAEVTKEGEDWIVSREGFDGTRTIYVKVIVNTEGLRQEQERAEGKLGWLLKTKLKSGDSWDMLEGGKRTVFGPEEVEVPAGKFQALRVVWKQNGSTYTSWYAPNVGEIKRTRKTGETESVTRSLKTFTEPKK
jgi:hypothetical protein